MIASIADVLVEIRKSGSVSDAELGLVNMLHVDAEQVIKDYLGYKVERDTWTEYYPQRDHGLAEYGIVRSGTTITLHERPVISITTLSEDSDGFFDQPTGTLFDTNLTEGDDFFWTLDIDTDGDGALDGSMTGKVTRRNREGWTVIPGSIKVTYVAGWLQANIPRSIKQAVAATVASWYAKTQSSGGPGRIVKAERLGDYAITYEVNGEDMNLAFPPNVKAMLQPWRRSRL